MAVNFVFQHFSFESVKTFLNYVGMRGYAFAVINICQSSPVPKSASPTDLLGCTWALDSAPHLDQALGGQHRWRFEQQQPKRIREFGSGIL